MDTSAKMERWAWKTQGIIITLIKREIHWKILSFYNANNKYYEKVRNIPIQGIDVFE